MHCRMNMSLEIIGCMATQILYRYIISGLEEFLKQTYHSELMELMVL